MALKFKSPSRIKKVLIYGKDGTGKSTFAADYCEEHGLKPVVIDVEDTNFTGLPIVDVDMSNDIKTYKGIVNVIDEIAEEPSFDTIIIDGVSSLLELLVSKARGMKKWSDRAERFQDILVHLYASKKNLIFIGQIDMDVVYGDDYQSSKQVIKTNSIVNEKYLCYKKKGGYSVKQVKERTERKPKVSVPTTTEEITEPETKPYEEPDFTTADDIKPIDVDPVLLNYCKTLKQKVENNGKTATKQSMKFMLLKCIKNNEINEDLKEPLIEFINFKCPEELI